MASDDELDLLVAQAVQTLRDRGGKFEANDVVTLVKRRKTDGLRAYARFLEKERTDREIETKKFQNPKIWAEIAKDRENYTEGMTQPLREQIDRLNECCLLLDEEVQTLHSELVKAQEHASEDRARLLEKVNELLKKKAELEGSRDALIDQITSLKADLEDEKDSHEVAAKKLAGLKRSLDVKTNEARTARLRSNELQVRLDKLESNMMKALFDLGEARSFACQLQTKLIDLESKLKLSQEQLADERNARAEADRLHAAAEACAKAMKDEIGRMMTREKPEKPEKPDKKAKTASENGKRSNLQDQSA